MSKKKSGVNYSKTVPKRARREAVIGRLELQLKSGIKMTKEGKEAPLTEPNIKRINKEITTLKTRI